MKKNLILIIIILLALRLHSPISHWQLQKKLKNYRTIVFEYLRQKCEQNNLCYFEKIKPQAKAESNFKYDCTEWQNGKPISFGIFQISIATAKWYLSVKKIDLRKEKIPLKLLKKYWHILKYFGWNSIERKIIIYLYSPFKNTDVHVWNTKRLLKKYKGCYLQALSAHNLGETGLMKYQKKRRRLYFPKYIELIKRRGGKF